VDGSLMWLVATITLRRFVAGSGRRPPHQNLTHAPQQTMFTGCNDSFDQFVGGHEPWIATKYVADDIRRRYAGNG